MSKYSSTKKKLLNFLAAVGTNLSLFFIYSVALLPVTIPFGFLAGVLHLIILNILIQFGIIVALFFICGLLWEKNNN